MVIKKLFDGIPNNLIPMSVMSVLTLLYNGIGYKHIPSTLRAVVLGSVNCLPSALSSW